MTYTPTREEFELVAEMMGVELLFGAYSLVLTREPDMPTSREWQPHLPGADCMELMAAIDAETNWTDESSVQVWGYHSYVMEYGEVCHNNTTADKARAIAEAVFKCAVQVARARKQSEQEKV